MIDIFKKLTKDSIGDLAQAFHHFLDRLFIYILGWLVYSAWAQVQFFGGPVWLTVLKAILILLLNQWVVSIGIMAAIITQRMLK